LANIAQLAPPVQQWASLVVWACQLLWQFTPRITSGFRTFAEQDRLFRDPNFNALPMTTSQHEYGFAVDIAPQVPPSSPNYWPQFALLVEAGMAFGMKWGGGSEPWHFQVFGREDWAQIIQLLNQPHDPQIRLQPPRPFEGSTPFAFPLGDPGGFTSGQIIPFREPAGKQTMTVPSPGGFTSGQIVPFSEPSGSTISPPSGNGF